MQIRDLLNDDQKQPEIKQHVTKTLFVIEGLECDEQFTKQFAPEIPAAIKLAAMNNGKTIDIISSFDEKHFKVMFQTADEIRLKKIILCILHEYKNTPNAGALIYAKIIKPCEDWVGKGFFKNFSMWVDKLEKNNIEELIALLQSELAGGTYGELFTLNLMNELTLIREEIQSMVNPISAENLLDFLRENPDIEVVYGILGKAHLPILKLIGTVTEVEDGYVQGEIHCDNLHVKVHLFGGQHGQIELYNKLSRQAEKDGLKVPVNKTLSSNTPAILNRIKFFEPEQLHSEGLQLLSTIRQLLPQVKNLGEEYDEIYWLAKDYIRKLPRPLCLSPTNISYLNYLQEQLKEALIEAGEQLSVDEEDSSSEKTKIIDDPSENDVIHSPIRKKPKNDF